MKNLSYNFIMNVQIFIVTYGIVVIVNPFTAITVIWPIQAITNIYMLSFRYIYIYIYVHLNTQYVYSEIVTLTEVQLLG